MHDSTNYTVTFNVRSNTLCIQCSITRIAFHSGDGTVDKHFAIGTLVMKLAVGMGTVQWTRDGTVCTWSSGSKIKRDDHLKDRV